MPHKFKDRRGLEWTLDMNVGVVKRVRDLTSVNLLDVLGGELIHRLADDPILLVDVLYAACKPEADERGVSDEEFGQHLVGDAIDDATGALRGALADFFPKRRRLYLQRAVQRVEEIQGLVMDRAERRLRDPGIEAEIERIFAPSPESKPTSSAGN